MLFHLPGHEVGYFSYEAPCVTNIPTTYSEGMLSANSWTPSLIEFDDSWQTEASTRPGHYRLSKGGAVLHFKLPDGPREPYNEVTLSFLANQLGVPAATTTFGILGGALGTASVITYDGQVTSEQEIVTQQGLRTTTAYTLFSALTITSDWKSDHYVTNGVTGEFIDWSHSLGGPNAITTVPMDMPWSHFADAPLGTHTAGNYPLIWQVVYQICSFPFAAVLHRAADDLVHVMPESRRQELLGAFTDTSNFLIARIPVLRRWVARASLHMRFSSI